MSLSGNILMLESEDGSTEPLAERIQHLGVDPTLVHSLDEAKHLLSSRMEIVSSLFIPTNLPGAMTARDLKKPLKELNRLAPGGRLVYVSVGKPPDASERKKLRSAGLQIALWEPFDDGTLRFQINRAISGDTNENNRRRPRVPTYLFARVYVGGRTKDTIIYSLSTGGAFLETPRASVNGAEFEVELRLPGKPIMARAVVVFSNVPGNLQRPNLPMGMGVRFEDLSKEAIKLLEGYIKARLEALNV